MLWPVGGTTSCVFPWILAFLVLFLLGFRSPPTPVLSTGACVSARYSLYSLYTYKWPDMHIQASKLPSLFPHRAVNLMMISVTDHLI